VKKILKIATQYGAYNVRVFVFLARVEVRLDSDVNFLVEIEPRRTLLEQIGLMQSLEELLKRKVDIAEPHTLYDIIRERVLKEKRNCYFIRDDSIDLKNLTACIEGIEIYPYNQKSLLYYLS
jgi:hypothetical protein